MDVTHPHVETEVRAGASFFGRSGGGAGVGRPEERDPDAVRSDVKNELISLKAARDVYKVVLDTDTLAVDVEATRKLRAPASST